MSKLELAAAVLAPVMKDIYQVSAFQAEVVGGRDEIAKSLAAFVNAFVDALTTGDSTLE